MEKDKNNKKIEELTLVLELPLMELPTSIPPEQKQKPAKATSYQDIISDAVVDHNILD